MKRRSLIFGLRMAAIGLMATLLPKVGQPQCRPRMGHHVDLGDSRWPAVVRGFVNAMRTGGEDRRVVAVRGYLEAIVKNTDWKTRNRLARWLDQSWAEFDPSPYEDLLQRLGCHRLLDMAQLWRSRDLQLAVYSKALSHGKASLPLGTNIYGVDAVTESAELGIADLSADVVGFYNRTWASDHLEPHATDELPGFVVSAFEQFKERFPLTTYELDLSLHEGGVDHEDANRLAARRLAEMPAEEFRNHIENDPGFSGVFWLIASYACNVNVFTGVQSDACEDIIKVYVHQAWLYRDLKKNDKHARWPKALDGLGGCVYKDVLFGDYAVPRELFMTPEHKKRLERTREGVKKAREEHKMEERNQAEDR